MEFKLGIDRRAAPQTETSAAYDRQTEGDGIPKARIAEGGPPAKQGGNRRDWFPSGPGDIVPHLV